MRVLLDTCVISELNRSGADARVRAAVAALQPEETFLSVITIGEVVKGVLRLPNGPKRTGLEAWVQSLDRQFAQRILHVDRDTAQLWAEICATGETRGWVPPPADGLIAATAIQHGLRIYTRNVKDFAQTGAMLVNPWKA